MGKRFEGEEPTYLDILAAFRLLGLESALGPEGNATAFTSRYMQGETLEIGVLPGSFSANEIAELRAWAA